MLSQAPLSFKIKLPDLQQLIDQKESHNLPAVLLPGEKAGAGITEY